MLRPIVGGAEADSIHRESESLDNLYHQEFKPLLKKAGLSGFTFHSLRHTCATLLCSKNVNPKIVQEMLGHATISQTMDTYSHVMPGMSGIAATALEEALS